MKTRKELLSVLEMNESEQEIWITKYIDENLPNKLPRWNRCEFSLNDLALELRDMATGKERSEFLKAMEEVFRCLCLSPDVDKSGFYIEKILQFFAMFAKSIEIIVAALLVLDCKDFCKKMEDGRGCNCSEDEKCLKDTAKPERKPD